MTWWKEQEMNMWTLSGEGGGMGYRDQQATMHSSCNILFSEHTHTKTQQTNYICTDSISNIHNQPTILKYEHAPTDSTWNMILHRKLCMSSITGSWSTLTASTTILCMASTNGSDQDWFLPYTLAPERKKTRNKNNFQQLSILQLMEQFMTTITTTSSRA